jgi:hypothetical protein
MSRILAAAISLIIILPFTSLPAQTTECDITMHDGDKLYRTQMVGQHEDLILVNEAQSYKIVNIRKIKSIRFDNGTYLWTGAGIGATVGFVGGLVLYEVLSKKKVSFLTKDASLGIGIIITVPCAIIGALIGNLYRNIDFYDLSEMGTYMKAKEIKFIMRDHSMWR